MSEPIGQIKIEFTPEEEKRLDEIRRSQNESRNTKVTLGGPCLPFPPDPRDAELAALRQQLADALKAIAWANNSLYGSHGFFLSTNGGPPDEHHLDKPIEELKRLMPRGRYRDAKLL